MVSVKDLLHDKEVIEKVKKNSKIIGIIFLIFGILGTLFPLIMSLTSAYFLAWILLFSGITIGFYTYKSNKKDWIGWLKAFIYVVTAILITIYPGIGVASLGIILAMYLLMDSFASFALAAQNKEQKNYWLIILNGVFSLILAIIFLVGWPFSSLFLVGLYVGISLFFDGVILLTMPSAIDKLQEEIQKQENSSTTSQASS